MRKELYKLKRKAEDTHKDPSKQIGQSKMCSISDCFSRLFLKSLKQQFDFNKACQLVLEYT